MTHVSDSVAIDPKRFGLDPADALAALGLRVLTSIAPSFVARMTRDTFMGYTHDDVKIYLENRRCCICDQKKGAQGLKTIFVGDKEKGAKIVFVCSDAAATCHDAAHFNNDSADAIEKMLAFNKAAAAAQWPAWEHNCNLLFAHLVAECKDLAPFEQLLLLTGMADSDVWDESMRVKNDDGNIVRALTACKHLVQAARRGALRIARTH